MADNNASPRQKMINMMYLVLTALLALNVSREVITAFVLTERRTTEATGSIEANNNVIYDEFSNAMADETQRGKVGPWKKKADKIKKEADDMYNFVQDLKIKIVRMEQGEKKEKITTEDRRKLNEDLKEVKKLDELNIGSQLLIKKKKGYELVKELDKYRKFLLRYLDKKNDEAFIKNINKILSTPNPPKKDGVDKDWVNTNFNDMPLIGVVSTLSGIQSSIRMGESIVLKKLYLNIDAASYKFNKLEAVVSSEQGFLIRGRSYKAKVFLAAIDTTQELRISGCSVISKKNGVGVVSLNSSSSGSKKLHGIITFEEPSTGIDVDYPFDYKYEVGSPSGTVSPTKMNVFYRGVSNPVDVSMSGVPPGSVRASMSNGRFSRSGNGYVARPGGGGTCIVRVSATVDGKAVSGGSHTFRVMPLPPPVASVSSKKGGRVSKGWLTAQTGVYAKPEGFLFDIKYSVVGFTVGTTGKDGFAISQKAYGGSFTTAQKQIFRSLRSGQRVSIESISAKGPDGKTHKIGSIVFIVR